MLLALEKKPAGFNSLKMFSTRFRQLIDWKWMKTFGSNFQWFSTVILTNALLLGLSLWLDKMIWCVWSNFILIFVTLMFSNYITNFLIKRQEPPSLWVSLKTCSGFFCVESIALFEKSFPSPFSRVCVMLFLGKNLRRQIMTHFGDLFRLCPPSLGGAY